MERIKGNRPKIILGKDHDNTYSTLMPHIDMDGVQVHPERVQEYMEYRKKLTLEKKIQKS